MKKVLITGITGQDGSYLAEFLLNKGYEVYGLVRRLSVPNDKNIKHLENKIILLSGDMTDQNSLTNAIYNSQPDEVYNLAAQSFVPASFEQPELTGNINGLGVVRILNAIKTVKNDARFYQAATSEMFGEVRETPQTESTPFHPRSPYGCSKVYAYWTTINYRESYNMFCCNGILFNHESPRRGLEFVTRKITNSITKINLGLQEELRIGNLEAKRDWGFAGDYVEAMWLILQQDQPNDYVIATNKNYSIREFIEKACDIIGIKLVWEGEGLEEVGINTKDNKKIIKVDKNYFRPAEVHTLRGDATKARTKLGWEPRVSFEELIEMMVKADLATIKNKNIFKYNY